MKILLLGEMSGYFMSLKQGLQELGHDVTLAANGDKWKKIPGADIPLIEYVEGKKSLWKKLDHYVYRPRHDKRLQGYDVVQLVGPGIYFWGAGYRPIRNLHKRNGKVFASIAGDDSFTYKAWKDGKFKYPKYLYENNVRLIRNHESFAGRVSAQLCMRIMRNADGIIPTNGYDYELPYLDFPNRRKTILLPLNTKRIEYHENVIKDGRIVFFHGLNRPEDKGTAYIVEAMDRIKEKYPNDVECISEGNLPYAEYIKLIERANVIVDQCRGYGYGMNALTAMAEGRVVMSNAEPEILPSIIGDCPIINIRPSVEQIENEIKRIIEERHSLPLRGSESRKFVERNHDYIMIAEQYIEEWSK